MPIIFAETARLTVVAALVMSAAWKLMNFKTYNIAMSVALRFLPRVLRRAIAVVLPVIELGVAGLALGRWPSARLSALPSIVFLLLVSMQFIVNRNQASAEGCGCWRPPATHTGPAVHLTRNALLVLLGAWAMIPALAVRSFADLAFACVSGAALAWVLMEMPNIHSTIMVMRPERGGGQ